MNAVEEVDPDHVTDDEEYHHFAIGVDDRGVALDVDRPDVRPVTVQANLTAIAPKAVLTNR